MVKGQAAMQYLLSPAEANSLPCQIVGPRWLKGAYTMFVNRAHAEQLAFHRWGGLAGLNDEKKKRRVKAEARHKQALKEYKKKKAAARKAGTTVPPVPKASSLLSNEINLHDGGRGTTMDYLRNWVLAYVGFSRKDAPSLPLRNEYDNITKPETFIMCRYCDEADPVPHHETVVYPGYDELGEEHLWKCEHNPDRWMYGESSEDDEEGEEDEEEEDSEEEE
jgi:hypothetical protein